MIGIQLYTVRDKTKEYKSALETIKELKAMGYECVQLAGNMEVIEITAKAAVEANMPVIGILVNMEICEEYQDKLFELARMCGATDIGISSSMKNDEQACDIIERANVFARIAHENGFSFSYHNHSNEFIRGECKKTLMQLILEKTDSKLFNLMPDTYWLQHGGVDVRAFIEGVKGRVKILHLKDMKRTVDGPTFSEIGIGNINFDGIIKTAKSAGVEHFIVEQDKCDGDSLDSARISCEYLRKNI